MSNRLEDFINNNREDFDRFEPGPVVWHNIKQELKKPAAKEGILISIRVLRWSSAAAVLLLLGAAYFLLTKKKPGTETEQIVKAAEPATNHLPLVITHDTVKEVRGNRQPEVPRPAHTQVAKTDEKEEYNEELYHYTRLVEMKQNEIRKIQKDEPLLYKQFAGDFSKLESTFHALKKQLPANSNHEQILEAMIQNLQYQEELLNQQLHIIKKINKTKKEAYEKAYKSV